MNATNDSFFMTLLDYFFGFMWGLRDMLSGGFSSVMYVLATGLAIGISGLLLVTIVIMFSWFVLMPIYAKARPKGYAQACVENALLPTNFLSWFFGGLIYLFFGRFGLINYARLVLFVIYVSYLFIVYVTQWVICLFKGEDDQLRNWAMSLPNVLWDYEDPVKKLAKLHNGMQNTMKSQMKPVGVKMRYYHYASVYLMYQLMFAENSNQSAKQLLASLRADSNLKDIFTQANSQTEYRKEANKIASLLATARKIPQLTAVKEDDVLDTTPEEGEQP